MRNRLKLLALASLAAIGLGATQLAHSDPPRGYGPDMMNEGYGHGAMDGHGRGGYYGPDRQGGRAYGPGMRGGCGQMGPGRWGGYGPGMMGGDGHGGFMMGGLRQLSDLSEEQRAKMDQILDETRRQNWDVMGRLLDERARLRDLMRADKRDASAIGKQSMKIADLRRQMLEAHVHARNRIEALLTAEQKKQLRAPRHGWMMDDDD